jgi:hypothetical protein
VKTRTISIIGISINPAFSSLLSEFGLEFSVINLFLKQNVELLGFIVKPNAYLTTLKRNRYQTSATKAF